MGENERMETQKIENKRWLAVGAAVLGAIAVVYLFLCGISGGDTLFVHTKVNGVSVGGMTCAQAGAELEQALDYNARYLTVNAGGTDYQVALDGVLQFSGEQAAQNAYNTSHKTWISRGWWWLAARFGGDSFWTLPKLADEERLIANVEQSGLMEVNTAIQTKWTVKEDQLYFRKGVSGESVDEAALVMAVEQAIENNEYDLTISCPMMQSAVKEINMERVYQKVSKEPQNATLDPENNYAIVDAVPGVTFDSVQAKQVLTAAGEGERVSVPLQYIEADISAKQLEAHLFETALGTCSTVVSGTADRVSNVSLAASKINGLILLPEEVFSYNGTVGERTAENGFKAAAAYLNGATVQELGGGICQVSSTLYEATLYSNLEIVERHNHTYASSYIGLGFDATVSWGGPDYQFKNNTEYPIRIDAYCSGGKVFCTIYGTNLTGTTVELNSEVLSETKYSTITKKDKNLKRGKKRVDVTGYTGYTVQTYRVVKDAAGVELSNEKEAYSSYAVRNKIVSVGAKKRH